MIEQTTTPTIFDDVRFVRIINYLCHLKTWSVISITALFTIPAARRSNLSQRSCNAIILRNIENQSTFFWTFYEALMFAGETPGLCCLNGKVKLSLLPTPPEPLYSLQLKNHEILFQTLKATTYVSKYLHLDQMIADSIRYVS